MPEIRPEREKGGDILALVRDRINGVNLESPRGTATGGEPCFVLDPSYRVEPESDDRAVVDGDAASYVIDVAVVAAPDCERNGNAHPEHAFRDSGRPRDLATATTGPMVSPPPAREDALDESMIADRLTRIEEDVLRETVSAILREELQGQLGERITRNVRKLVRREIRRMLAEDELD